MPDNSHEALDRSVRDKLAAVVGGLSISNPEPTEEQISALTEQIGNAVKSAIGDGVSVLGWLRALGNMDDQIGSTVLRFAHAQLEESAGTSLPFSRRRDNEGDWELFGHITATISRRPESNCCAQLKRILDQHEKRISKLELQNRLEQQAKGSEELDAAKSRKEKTPKARR